MSRWRDPHLQVGKKYFYLYNLNKNNYANPANLMLISTLFFTCVFQYRSFQVHDMIISIHIWINRYRLPAPGIKSFLMPGLRLPIAWLRHTHSFISTIRAIPSNTIHRNNVGLLSGQRAEGLPTCWSTLFRCLAFARTIVKHNRIFPTHATLTAHPCVLTLSSLTLHCHFHPLQAANCCRNSRLVVDENVLKWVKY